MSIQQKGAVIWNSILIKLTSHCILLHVYLITDLLTYNNY
jgi:hypothetical protein